MPFQPNIPQWLIDAYAGRMPQPPVAQPPGPPQGINPATGQPPLTPEQMTAHEVDTLRAGGPQADAIKSVDRQKLWKVKKLNGPSQ